MRTERDGAAFLRGEAASAYDFIMVTLKFENTPMDAAGSTCFDSKTFVYVSGACTLSAFFPFGIGAMALEATAAAFGLAYIACIVVQTFGESAGTVREWG